MYVKTHGIIFISMLTLAILSPKTDISVYSKEIGAKETKTTSGSMESRVDEKVQTGTKKDKREKGVGNISRKNDELRKLNGTIERIPCESTCKIQTLKDIGIRPEIAESLVNNCKAMANDPRKCAIVGASIVKNESSGGYKCKSKNKYNCFGLSVQDDYKSYNDGVIHFIGKWNKYWHKAEDMTHFYSVSGKLPPTRFCVSEDSTGTSVGCPAGLRNSTIIFNKLDKLW